MRFALTDEQSDFAAALDRLLSAADCSAAARAWADGDHAPGLDLWKRLAEQGVPALVVPEESGGLGAGPVELMIAFEALGRYAVPGPWVETAAYLPVALDDPQLLGALAAGAIGTVAAPPVTPYALDADVAEHSYLAADGRLSPAEFGEERRSLDPTRRLFVVSTGSTTGAGATTADGPTTRDLDGAFDLAALATSAQLLGLGEHLLDASVAYVKERRQFGREIGSYQAIKHRLADVRIALDFARPLVFGAALAGSRNVSAAKVAASDSAYLAARTALQVHGAIGYTRELDLSLWILKVRALVGAWGTPAHHRARVLDALVSSGGGD